MGMARHHKLTVICLVITVLVMSAVGACTAVPEAPEVPKTITWNYHTAYSESYYLGAMNKHLAELVEEKTDGRLKLQIFYSAGLGYKGPEVIDAVNRGALEAGEWLPYLNFSELGQWALAFEYDMILLDNWDRQLQYVEAIEFPLIKSKAKELWPDAEVFLYSSGPGEMPQGFWSTKKIEKLEDLRGLKVRNPGYMKVAQAAFEPLGLASVFIPGAEIFQALKTGLVDMALQTPQVGLSSRYTEMCPYYYAFAPFAAGNWGFAYSKKLASELPQDVQQGLQEACEEQEYWVTNEFYKDFCSYTPGYGGDMCAREAIEELEKTGFTVRRFDEFRQYAVSQCLPALPEWAATVGPDAENIAKAVLEAREKYPGGDPLYDSLKPIEATQ